MPATSKRWSCNEKQGECRNPHGCHCAEIDALLLRIEVESERCAKICEAQRDSKADIVAPLADAAYDKACRDCAAAIRS